MAKQETQKELQERFGAWTELPDAPLVLPSEERIKAYLEKVVLDESLDRYDFFATGPIGLKIHLGVKKTDVDGSHLDAATITRRTRHARRTVASKLAELEYLHAIWCAEGRP